MPQHQLSFITVQFVAEMRLKAEREGKQLRSSIPCTDTSDRENYLRRADVREALHVLSQAFDWEACRSVDS